MCRREAETSPSERAHKKRRVSYSTTTMSQTTETNAPQLPSVQLTPIESTLKELLLDVAKYIREQTIAKGGSEDTPQTELRFTGGWVRDKLLGVDSHDIDVGISSMTGYQYGMALKEYLDIPENLDKYKKNHPDGKINEAIVSLHKIDANPEKSKHLETATTKIFGLDIDLVNLRKETYLEDSRNPQMEFGTAQEDAMRRDATINALFYNLNESKVEDLTGLGFTDMQNKIIRTPLEPFQTFKDDPLRVLRLVRFASRLGYRIHEDTEVAMHNDEISEALKLKISRERVGTELDKMLQGSLVSVPRNSNCYSYKIQDLIPKAHWKLSTALDFILRYLPTFRMTLRQIHPLGLLHIMLSKSCCTQPSRVMKGSRVLSSVCALFSFVINWKPTMHGPSLRFCLGLVFQFALPRTPRANQIHRARLRSQETAFAPTTGLLVYCVKHQITGGASLMSSQLI